MNDFLIQCCILILLPIIPAIILFRGLRGAAKGEGAMFGMKWSFGGAFAGYLIVLLLLWKAMEAHFQLIDAEVWTVKGRVISTSSQDVANRISIKSFPQSLMLDQSGEYQFRIIVGRQGDLLDFPKVMVDLSLLCAGIKTVRLDDQKGTFPALGNNSPIKIKKSSSTRSIEVDPIEVPPLPPGNICGQA